MNHGLIFGLIGVMAAIIGTWLSWKKSIKSDQKSEDNKKTLNLLAENEMKHFKEDLQEIKDDLKAIWKEINFLKKDNKSECERISAIEGELKKGGS